MIDKTPYVYISKDVNLILDVVQDKKEISKIATNSFLFSPTNNNNLISLESIHINNTFEIVVKLLDPTGLFESKFTAGSTLINTEAISTYNIDNKEFFLVYGIGQDYQNRSAIQRVQLTKATLDISKGRILTLKFKESGSNYDATKLSKFRSNDPHNFSIGESKIFSMYGVEKEDGYSVQDAISDCFISTLRKKYSTDNILLLLPDMSNYFLDSKNGSLLNNKGIQGNHTDAYRRLMSILGSMSISEAAPDYSLTYDILSVVPLAAKKRGLVNLNADENAKIAASRPPIIYPEGYPELGYVTFDPDHISPGGASRNPKKLVLKTLSADSYQKFVNTYGNAVIAAPSVAESIAGINSLGDSPAISWVEYVETDHNLANYFFENLKGSPILGGHAVDASDLTNDTPLVICGDSDLINEYLYKNKVLYNTKKIPRAKFLQTLQTLTLYESYADIRFPYLTLNETLLPFIRSIKKKGRSQKDVLKVIDVFTSSKIGDKVRPNDVVPQFSFGYADGNVTDISVDNNPFYFTQLVDHINSNYSNDDLVKVLELVAQPSKFIEELNSTLFADDSYTSDSIKSIILKHTNQNVTDEDILILVEMFNISKQLSKNQISFNGETVPTDNLDFIKDKLINTSEFLVSMSRLVYQITVKSLPFFLKSTNKDLNNKVSLYISEPPVLGATQSSILPTSEFYNGEYYIRGYRHVLSNNNMFSEFKLVKTEGLRAPLLVPPVEEYAVEIKTEEPQPTEEGFFRRLGRIWRVL